MLVPLLMLYFGLGACYSCVLPSSVYARSMWYILLYGFSSVIFWPIFFVINRITLYKLERKNKK